MIFQPNIFQKNDFECGSTFSAALKACCKPLAATRSFLFDNTSGGSGPSVDKTQQTASGDGINVGTKGKLTESGALGVYGGSNYTEAGGYNLAGVKLKKGSSINIEQGVGQEALQGLVNNLTSATGSQISAVQDAAQKELDKLTGLISQQSDSTAGNPRTLAFVVVAAMSLVGLAVWFIFRKR